MTTIEKSIKDQYAKVFKKKDWENFKLIADYYLNKAATLKRKDIDINDNLKLLVRNIQKRLFLGIASELLIKACYLKCGYVINKPKDTNNKSILTKFSSIKVSALNADDTFTLGPLLGKLNKITTFTQWSEIEKGFKILKVFRNKEGHVATIWHKFNPQNYRDIETSIKLLYKDVFNEVIDFHIYMEANDKGKFKIHQ